MEDGEQFTGLFAGQSTLARIASGDLIETQPALAAIASNELMETQSTLARIASGDLIETQPALAAIASSELIETQSTLSRIASSELLETQPALAALAANDFEETDWTGSDQLIGSVARELSRVTTKGLDSDTSSTELGLIFQQTVDPYGPLRDDISQTRSLAARVVVAAAFDQGELSKEMSEEQKKKLRAGIAVSLGITIAISFYPFFGDEATLALALGASTFISSQLEDYYNIKRRQQLPEEK
ncbi:hypothetical protein HALLA_17530 [Halostagnicola larsenii XH-48]|uniref:Uncharacterized protein n=1 Tax=Halostagnicola larsenii XH-48 TaxID=797299 RepID=W0JQX1_9EURY|nr:hypothetical protein [Halostagnicola larsenii]AHG01131.1 hypothetical protein HALLA_17530 [Halostagnicola larsenii XH-48]